jgi:hypothetical protein
MKALIQSLKPFFSVVKCGSTVAFVACFLYVEKRVSGCLLRIRFYTNICILTEFRTIMEGLSVKDLDTWIPLKIYGNPSTYFHVYCSRTIHLIVFNRNCKDNFLFNIYFYLAYFEIFNFQFSKYKLQFFWVHAFLYFMKPICSLPSSQLNPILKQLNESMHSRTIHFNIH